MPRRYASDFRVYPPGGIADVGGARPAKRGLPCECRVDNSTPESVAVQHDRKSGAGRGFAAPLRE